MPSRHLPPPENCHLGYQPPGSSLNSNLTINPNPLTLTLTLSNHNRGQQMSAAAVFTRGKGMGQKGRGECPITSSEVVHSMRMASCGYLDVWTLAVDGPAASVLESGTIELCTTMCSSASGHSRTPVSGSFHGRGDRAPAVPAAAAAC